MPLPYPLFPPPPSQPTLNSPHLLLSLQIKADLASIQSLLHSVAAAVGVGVATSALQDGAKTTPTPLDGAVLPLPLQSLVPAAAAAATTVKSSTLPTLAEDSSKQELSHCASATCNHGCLSPAKQRRKILRRGPKLAVAAAAATAAAAAATAAAAAVCRRQQRSRVQLRRLHSAATTDQRSRWSAGRRGGGSGGWRPSPIHHSELRFGINMNSQCGSSGPTQPDLTSPLGQLMQAPTVKGTEEEPPIYNFDNSSNSEGCSVNEVNGGGCSYANPSNDQAFIKDSADTTSADAADATTAAGITDYGNDQIEAHQLFSSALLPPNSAQLSSNASPASATLVFTAALPTIFTDVNTSALAAAASLPPPPQDETGNEHPRSIANGAAAAFAVEAPVQEGQQEN
jgi:hypothetical protein